MQPLALQCRSISLLALWQSTRTYIEKEKKKNQGKMKITRSGRTNLESKFFAGDYGKTLDHLAVDAQPEYVVGYLVIVLHGSSLGFFVQEIKVGVAVHRRRRRGRARHFGVVATVVPGRLSRRDIISQPCYGGIRCGRRRRRQSREGLGRREQSMRPRIRCRRR